jgi:hypothetical protein
MFKSDLYVRTLTEDLWCVVKPLIWVSRGETITVPKGFITDLASIPRIFRNLPLLDVDGLSRRPAALHDWLYAGERWRTKPFADATLREALTCEGVSKIGAQIYYLAVHWFGRGGWTSDGQRVSYSNGVGQLDKCDFDTPQDYERWLATAPQRTPLP